MSPLSSDPAAREKQLANLQTAPPAPPENQRARRHGAYAAIARDRLDDKVREIADALAEDAPLRDAGGGLPPADALMVELLAEAIVRRHDLRDYLADYGWKDEKTKAPKTALLDLEARLRREAAGYADALAMSPRARVKVGADLARTAVDAATALSEPDPELRRQLMQAAGLLPRETGDGGT